MSAKILYTANGNDPLTIIWPPLGPSSDQVTLTSGQPVIVPNLIGYGDGTITYSDGRLFPAVTPNGSTFVEQKG